MADEVEKPKKTKRSKSANKSTEDIPLSTMDSSSSKFNLLLKQAVDESLSEAKQEKKKKKKKDSAVLESLRKGEGLQKEVDETQLANTFNPDDTKYEKSNKKKQKFVEDKNKQNELEIVDETKGKTKKKKKQKGQDELIENVSEDELSQLTTPKKKPRKKPGDGEQTPEHVLTPTKKKKGKTEEQTVHTEDETATGKKKKKKKGGETDEEAIMSPAEDSIRSPRGKKKKKKTGGETEDEAALSPSEEATSPKGKKGKKKKPAADDEEPKSPKQKKGKKGEVTDEEALSPAEDVEDKKDKKKKKKKKVAEDETQEDEGTEGETEAPKPKERKKKKKKKEEDEAEDAGMDVEDEGRILACTVHRTDKLKNDFFILHPMVRVHVFDELTGRYLTKQHKERAVTAFYETMNDNLKHVLPIMTKPFDFKENKSVLPVWEELLVFNENYNYFIQQKPKVLIVFELVDFVSMNRAASQDDRRTDKGLHRIAWAFLKVVGNNNKINTEEEHFLWWKLCPRKSYPSTLYITLKGIRPPRDVEPAERSLFATQEERGRMTYEDLKKSINWAGKKSAKKHPLTSWSRLAGQLCRIPNTLALSLPTGKRGCYVVRFSHDGRSLACACQGNEGFPILVYEIPSGTLKGKFIGHFGIVYDMSWSKTDTHLLSASSDGTARIWSVQEFGEDQEKLLPHPSFVYCGQFHPRVDSIAVTGSYDQVIRVWDVSDDGDKFTLRLELEDHQGLINSLCFSDDGERMFSADSMGIIIIWNSFFSETPAKRGVARDWTLFKKIEDPDIKGTVINYICLHPRERRLLVHCRDNIIRMFDLRIERVMQKYVGALNFREQIRSALSPCGSFVFSGSEDNFAYAWNTDTGDQMIMYSELNYQNPVTDVHYHPRDHMVAFCSLGENHPVLVYSYDAHIAQYEAGLSPRMISPLPAEEGTLGTPQLAEELATKGVLSRDEFNIHTSQRYDRVMKNLNKMTAQMVATPSLELPGTAVLSPRNTMMTLGSTGYDMYGTSPRTMTDPTMFSPHAGRSMEATKRHQQFASQSQYMKGVDSWRPTFQEVGRQGRSSSPVFGRQPQLSMTASQGKAQFNFQAAPGKTGQKQERVVAIYDYKAQRSDELDLFNGDEILVLYRDTENWWMGELRNGQQGFFPANYVISEDQQEDYKGRGALTPDSSDSEKKQVTAVRTPSGELKFVSGEDDRRRRKRNTQDSGPSGANHTGGTNSRKPPRKSAQKVRISEDTLESNA
ncbi:AHI1-like protein [Mya arenaria]|uniref:AHI1-like protein n=1 Tax=Mya arenaria TaxID=6604 RepID=A0ABY7FRE9_MYAAR|nr:AHI1-like protein [Mya arenaria]